MIDCKLKDGDTAADSTGRTIEIEGADAAFQSAFIRAGAKLGGFIYDRSLGSRVDSSMLSDADSAGKLRLALNEALAGMENTYAEVESYDGESVTLKISINGESRTQEVRFYADV